MPPLPPPRWSSASTTTTTTSSSSYSPKQHASSSSSSPLRALLLPLCCAGLLLGLLAAVHLGVDMTALSASAGSAGRRSLAEGAAAASAAISATAARIRAALLGASSSTTSSSSSATLAAAAAAKSGVPELAEVEQQLRELEGLRQGLLLRQQALMQRQQPLLQALMQAGAGPGTGGRRRLMQFLEAGTATAKRQMHSAASSSSSAGASLSEAERQHQAEEAQLELSDREMELRVQQQEAEAEAEAGAAAAAAAGAVDVGPKVVLPPLEQYTFDIALSSGYRPQYGATFSSCLVSLMASGAMRHASALHVLLSDAKLLNFSLVHNLAHMGSRVRVSLYDMAGASNSMRARNTFYQLLRAPDLVPGGPGQPSAFGASLPASASTSTSASASSAASQGSDKAAAASASSSAAAANAPAPASSAGGSDLPAVFLEDDVWLLDDFARKMHAVATHAARRTGGKPFVIKLYLHSGKYGSPAVIREHHKQTCNATPTDFAPLIAAAHYAPGGAVQSAAAGGPGAILVTSSGGEGQYTHNATSGGGNGTTPMSNEDMVRQLGYKAKPRAYRWGAQGLYFSDGRFRRRLADCFLQYTDKKYEKQRRYKDWPLKTCLGSMGVASFDSGKSLVQHIGASSSLFGNAESNSRYHRACSFPFVERLPAEDSPAEWY